jgi:hypothetical protein
MLRETIYRVSESAPHTGIYRVFHYQHRLPHNVVVKQGERFPPCNKCGERVSFRLSSAAESLLSDRDFMIKAA